MTHLDLNDNEYVNIIVEGSTFPVKFKILPNQYFNSLFKSFCSREGYNPNTTGFIYNNKIVKGNETCLSFDMHKNETYIFKAGTITHN